MPPLKTVTIKTDNGPVRINETDFDPDKHTLADGEKAPETNSEPSPTVVPDPNAQTIPTTPPAPPPPPLPPAAPPKPQGVPVEDRMIAKSGKKYFIMDADGKKLDANGVRDDNVTGFDTEEAARNSLKA